MRDPARIRKLLDRLAEVWETYPDLRLGQLIGNLGHSDQVLYNIEDEELIDEICNLYVPEVISCPECGELERKDLIGLFGHCTVCAADGVGLDD